MLIIFIIHNEVAGFEPARLGSKSYALPTWLYLNKINHKRVNKVKKELPVGMILLWFMDRVGFEPTTRRLKADYSDQLSYPSKKILSNVTSVSQSTTFN